MSVQSDLSCLPAVLAIASVSKGGYCSLPNTPHTKHTVIYQDIVDYCELVPEKESLNEIPTRRFSVCSGVLLLGALKRPTKPAKNQSAAV